MFYLDFVRKLLLVAVIGLLTLLATSGRSHAESNSQERNDLDALWNYYNYTYIQNGRVIALDENSITTSEGQSYAMLRAVWSGDRQSFDSIWSWTQKNLSRPDHLFSWKWKDGILDKNSATDADTDIALALLLAAERFDESAYRKQALLVINSIWKQEVVEIKGRHFITGGNWAPGERYPSVHVGYLAAYAYEIFSKTDSAHPWKDLIQTSYDILDWIFIQQDLALPPEIIYLDRQSGKFILSSPDKASDSRFSYDVFPIYWRVAIDEQWFGRDKRALRQKMLQFFEYEWEKRQLFYDRYSLKGEPQSRNEALPLYATVLSLARINKSEIATPLSNQKIDTLWANALTGNNTPYYLHNWLWFDRALKLKRARSFNEFLSFLYPFDVANFSSYLPAGLLILFLLLAFFSKVAPANINTAVRFAALVLGFYLCGRYLFWRVQFSLNFIEPTGPYISIALLAAEFYCFTTVLLLLAQVGVHPVKQRIITNAEKAYQPSVDIFVPIFSESLEILESTLLAIQLMHYKNKNVYVCDDSHRDTVRQLAEQLGAHYIKGPKKHAKAGNINNALAQTNGELILIFDTDHMPVRTFLNETVPFMADKKVGFVQTSHHFFNPDIFQNALRTPEFVADEQEFFHQGIQPARDKWGGVFFVGTGALFRRKALEDVGGLLLMSITEDIHTSQHIHAKGWESRYVAKNLAVGLNAENLSSYLVQRTRWMQGCLQVFFKDNPLFTRGLPLRHRIGYFASQYYFFFPIARVIFFLAPLFYLLFHWHPILADVSTLLAYLIPFMICLPILSQMLTPGWPRIIWASAYENTISAALFRGMFDLLLPKKLSFKVTPKGINSDESRFDFASSRYTLIIFAITLIAVLKGLLEYFYFGIEKDAYFFNLGWASVNLLLLITPLVIAREHPRYAYQNRIRKNLPVSIRALGFDVDGNTYDIDDTGFSMIYDNQVDIPQRVGVCLGNNPPHSILATPAFYDKDEQGNKRVGFDFIQPDRDLRKWILQHVHCDAETWTVRQKKRTQSNVLMIGAYFYGLWKSVWRPQERRRMQPRDRVFKLIKLPFSQEIKWALVTDQSRNGLKAYVLGKQLSGQDTVPINAFGKTGQYQIVHRHSPFPGVIRIGLKVLFIQAG